MFYLLSWRKYVHIIVYIYINISVIGVMVDLMWVGAMRLRKEGENLNVAEKFIWDIDTQGSIVKSMT